MQNSKRKRIKDLHERAFIVDAHFDLTLDVAYRRERGEQKVIESSYIDDFRRGGVDLIVSAMFVHDYFLPEMGLRKALDQISYLHEEIDESPGKFRLCRTVGEARAAKADGAVGLLQLSGLFAGSVKILRNTLAPLPRASSKNP